jgi:hypothetical protein
MIHFHVRWLGKNKKEKIDWARFDSEVDAEKFAQDLVLPDEKYVIERFDENCQTCQSARKH